METLCLLLLLHNLTFHICIVYHLFAVCCMQGRWQKAAELLILTGLVSQLHHHWKLAVLQGEVIHPSPVPFPWPALPSPRCCYQHSYSHTVYQEGVTHLKN